MSQANVFAGFSLTTTFPDHDPCFGNDPTNTTCSIPSLAMINFLNISNPDSYSKLLPAVRFSAYFTSLVSAILVLYSPEEVESSFLAQLLNVYSLIVASMIAIARNHLTKFHSVVALTLASSPLSVYLLFYVIRSLFGIHTRLDKVFGKGKHVNRTMVLLAFPLWLAVLCFTALPSTAWDFQQTACDLIIAGDAKSILAEHSSQYFYWHGERLSIDCERRLGKHNKFFPLGRLWHRVGRHYPFIYFCSVIVLPHFIWIFNVEIALPILSTRESFSATYGQLLAIFVTVLPFIQLCKLLPRASRWFGI
ncbi:hypothetical protein B0H13DRAFT_2323322 [Mycena leptocephala]|nr:hypothetical protein B0H13DRAFT_2323322 [Mycena leptocephala]